MRSVFALFAAALGGGAAAGAAVAWDGGYYLFKVLDQQAPFIPHDRWINLPIQWVVLAASRLTRDVGILIIVFGMVYAVFILGLLALAWWIVRDESPRLFVWPVLSLGLGLLPGLFAFVSEAVIIVVVFWPILLSLLVRTRPAQALAVAVLSVLAILIHPFAIPLLACAAGLALIVGWRHREQRRVKWLWSAWFAALTIATALHFVYAHSSYEADQMSVTSVLTSFRSAMAGMPLLALVGAYFAGLATLAATWHRRSQRLRMTIGTRPMERIGVAVAGAALCLWAGDPRMWGAEIAYRTLTLFVTLPFIGFAAFDVLATKSDGIRDHQVEWRHRARTTQLVAFVFASVLVIQSVVWMSLTERLAALMTGSPAACVPTSAVARGLGTGQTAISHWSVTSFSLLIQGRRPTKVVLEDDLCTSAHLAEGLPIAGWDTRRWGDGSVDMQLLRGALDGGG